MTTEISFPVRYTDIDALGIVHHSNYLKWFEAGRIDFLRNADMPNHKLNMMGYFLPLSEMRCTYKSPVKYGNKILIRTNLIYMSCAKVKFEYRALNKSSGKVIAIGTTVHAWTDKGINPLNIEKAAPEVYRKLENLVESGETLNT